MAIASIIIYPVTECIDSFIEKLPAFNQAWEIDDHTSPLFNIGRILYQSKTFLSDWKEFRRPSFIKRFLILQTVVTELNYSWKCNIFIIIINIECHMKDKNTIMMRLTRTIKWQNLILFKDKLHISYYNDNIIASSFSSITNTIMRNDEHVMGNRLT